MNGLFLREKLLSEYMGKSAAGGVKVGTTRLNIQTSGHDTKENSVRSVLYETYHQ